MTQANPALEHEPPPTPVESTSTASTAVLILGMHRSGTSVLARVLNLMGVELGADLLPPAPDNETGFWEHRAVQFIHDRVYEELKCDWTNVSALPPLWWERAELQPWREELKKVLLCDFAHAPLWGVKDPRLCVMLPLWRPLLAEMNCQPRCVMIVRNPAEVAKSLQKRDGISISRAYLLWVRSVIDAERHSRGLPRTLSTYEQILADWQGQITRMGRDLQLTWPGAPEAVAESVAEFIRPSSRHHQVDDAGFLADEQVPRFVRELYAAVLASAHSGDWEQLSTATADAATTLEREDTLLTHFIADLEREHRSLIIERNKQAISFHAEEGRLRQELETNRDAVAQRDACIEVLDLDKSNLEAKACDLNAQVEASRAELVSAANAIAQLGEQVAAQTEAIALRDQLVLRVQKLVSEQSALVSVSERNLLQTASELRRAYQTRDTLGPELQSVLQSSLWFWGRPAWLLKRAAGRLAVGIDRLVPLTPAVRGDNGSWIGNVQSQFLIPIVPLHGWVRLRARIRSTAASRAALYMDTGSGFHQREHIELAPVAGETLIDRMIALRTTTYLLRFDPVQAAGEFAIESFSLEPMSAIGFNIRALRGNLWKLLSGQGTHRPSVLLGLKLLVSGQWSKFHRQLVSNVESSTAVSEYDLWQKRHEITPEKRKQMREQMAKWANPPKISVILPVYNVAEVYLRKCIDSVLHQVYLNWELCVADDASPKPHIQRVLKEYADRDPRIKVVYRTTNGGISAGSNSALELATGEFLALLDHDDELSEHALFRVAEALTENPSLDMIYSDEDKITPAGKRFDPFFKPDWSPEYFLACMYTCHLGVYRANLVRELGGWRSALDSSQDYDLVLRIVANNPKIHHIPDVLYHWRTIPTSTASGGGAKPEAHARARLSLQKFLELTGRPGTVEPGPSEGFHRVRYEIRGNPKVSIIIPSACREMKIRGRQTWFVLECVSSVRRLSTYKNLEIIVLDNDDIPPRLSAALLPFDIRLIPFTEPFNLARKINVGAFAATGEHLILLNDDVKVITPDWIQSMLEYSQWPEIGAVGAQLLFPNNMQQHNGVNLLDGTPGHPFYQFPGDHTGYFNSSVVHRNWSAVTGACVMTRADVFRSVGGFSESLPLNYNDVDYCLKVIDTGKRIVYMPYAKLYHHESVSRVGTEIAELEAFKKIWAHRLPHDPYYNPNLTMQTCDFRIG